MNLSTIKSIGLVRRALPYIPDSIRIPVRWINGAFEYDHKLYNEVNLAFRQRGVRSDFDKDPEFLNVLHRLFVIPERGKYEYDDLDFFLQPHSPFLEYCNRYCPLRGKDLLDVGTGYGGLLLYRDTYGLRSATGVDFVKNRFDALCERQKIKASSTMTYISGDFVTTGFGEQKFDIITSLDCFEHFRSPELVFNKCVDLLRRGGHMVFTFGPLFRSPYGAHRFRYTGIPYFQNLFSDETVLQFFSQLDVLKEFRDHNGYTEVEIQGDPYAEMNRWRARRFVELFTGDDRVEIIRLVKKKDYRFWWFRKLAKSYMNDCLSEDVSVDEIEVIMRKN